MKKFVLFFTILFALWSCVKEIDYDNNIEPQIGYSIYGNFTNIQEEQVIYINNITSIADTASVLAEPVSGANVKILSDDAKVIYFRESKPGKYTSNSKGEIGRKYKLNISVEEMEIESEFTSMIEPSTIDSIVSEINSELITEENGKLKYIEQVSFYLNSTLKNSKGSTYALFLVENEFEFLEEYNIVSNHICYIKRPANNGVILSSYGGDLPNDRLLLKKVADVKYDYRFFEEFCFHVNQLTVDKNTYEYWQNLASITKERINIFDPPPGRIFGNIRTDNKDIPIFGNFTVASKVSKRTFTNQRLLNKIVRSKCSVSGNSIFLCTDCIKTKGATYSKPEYWPN